MLPQHADARSDSRSVKQKTLRVFEFNSQTLKSGVVVSSDDAASGTGLVVVKGAHTAIKGLMLPASLPPDFDQVCLLAALLLLWTVCIYQGVHSHTL